MLLPGCMPKAVLVLTAMMTPDSLALLPARCSANLPLAGTACVHHVLRSPDSLALPHCQSPPGRYSLWGTYTEGSKLVREPNRLTGPELCAGANMTQAAGGAWAWSDAPCAQPHAFICKTCGCRLCTGLCVQSTCCVLHSHCVGARAASTCAFCLLPQAVLTGMSSALAYLCTRRQ